MSKASKDIMEELHGAVAKDLLSKIATGEAKANDLGVAVRFLKDNGVEAIAVDGSPLANLLESLPFDSKDQISDKSKH
jgi:hypothetical protein